MHRSTLLRNGNTHIKDATPPPMLLATATKRRSVTPLPPLRKRKATRSPPPLPRRFTCKYAATDKKDKCCSFIVPVTGVLVVLDRAKGYDVLEGASKAAAAPSSGRSTDTSLRL